MQSKMEETDKDLLQVLYGWKDVDHHNVIDILRTIGITNARWEEEWKSISEGDEDYIDVANEIMAEFATMEDKKGFNFYYFPWDHDHTSGLYFGIILETNQIGTYGEPRFGTKIMSELFLGSILEKIRNNHVICDKISDIIDGEPSIIIISKAY